MAENVEITITAEDDASAAFREIFRAMGDVEDEMAQLQRSTESLAFQDAAQQAEGLGKEIEDTGTKAKEASSVFGELGQAIMQGLGLGAGMSIFSGITSGIQSLIDGFKSAIVEASAAEDAQTKLGAILKATGGVSGVTADQVNDLATEIQRLTRFEDDAVVSASTVMLTFRNITSTTFPQAIKAAADLAAMWGMDLSSAARMVGRALDSPGEALGMLTRLGVQFTDEQKAVMKQLVDTGRAAEAQGMILDILSSKFGGTAEAMAGTYAGRVEQLKVKFGNLKEEIGMGLLPILTKFVDMLSTGLNGKESIIQGITEAFKSIYYAIDPTIENFKSFGRALGLIGDFAGAVAASFAEFWRNAIAIVVNSFLSLINIAMTYNSIQRLNFTEAGKYFDQFKASSDAITTGMTDLGASLSTTANDLSAAWAQMTADIRAVGEEIDRTKLKVTGWGASRAPADIGRGSPPAARPAQGYMSNVLPADAQRAIAAAATAGTKTGESYGDSFKAAVKKSDIPGYLESDIKSAQEKLRGLVPEMFPDLTAPGANGPFEKIFQAADVAKRGADSPWAAVLGLDQETAKAIVQKFGAGIIDESVKGLIDMDALKNAAAMKSMAEKLTSQFAGELSGAMTNSTDLRTAGSSALGTLKSGIDAAAPGLVDGLKTSITDPIITAFDAATSAVQRLIDAINKLKNMGGVPGGGGAGAGGGGGGGGGGATESFMVTARARGYA